MVFPASRTCINDQGSIRMHRLKRIDRIGIVAVRWIDRRLDMIGVGVHSDKHKATARQVYNYGGAHAFACLEQVNKRLGETSVIKTSVARRLNRELSFPITN
jgi:hypothetical protein